MKSFSNYVLESSLVDKMKQRTNDHISRVKFFYNALIDNGMIPEDDIIDIEKHDLDKLVPENLKRQALRFKTERTNDDEKKINDVIREHVKSNPHHCEYWGSPEQDHRSSGIDCSRMPAKYLYEMLADWAATSEEKGNTIMEYYNDVNGKRYIFTGWQQEMIEKISPFLEQQKDTSLKRQYSNVYIDPGYKI